MKGRLRFAVAFLSASAVLPVLAGAASDPASPPGGQGQPLPDGVAFNAQTSTYSVHRVPKRSLEEVMNSIAQWKHQILGDDSTADFSAEDGILSMECSGCGLARPSAIDLAMVDLETVMAYEAGAWHIGIRSKDGTQDFFGVLRGELGPQPHDAVRVGADQSVALMALADLYDLAYLTQNPRTTQSTAPPQSAAASQSSAKAADAPSVPPPAKAPKPTVTPIATLAAHGDLEGLQARRTKTNSRELANALETAYGVRARAQMLEGQVDAALQTLGAGRQSFGKSAALRDREAHYVVIGDVYDRLRLAVKLDTGQIRDYLRQIQALEPDDAAAIQQMLVHTFANRIADQRAAGRKNIADDLTSTGKDLFPASADQLSQGKVGSLTQAGVEIDADAPYRAEVSSAGGASR